MKDPRKEAFNAYARRLADLMGLLDWIIGIGDEPPEPRNLAECDARYGRKIAWIHLSESFFNSTPVRQRQTIVHELLHAHNAHAEHLLHDELSDTALRAYTLAHEYAIDGIAEAWSRSLPLPEES